MFSFIFGLSKSIGFKSVVILLKILPLPPSMCLALKFGTQLKIISRNKYKANKDHLSTKEKQKKIQTAILASKITLHIRRLFALLDIPCNNSPNTLRVL